MFYQYILEETERERKEQMRKAQDFMKRLKQAEDSARKLPSRYNAGPRDTAYKQYGKPGEMDVLILYNCIHFLDEFKYVG